MEHLFQFVKDARDAEQLIQIFKICLSTGARIMEAAELKLEDSGRVNLSQIARDIKLSSQCFG
ncbi:hypothetical protein L8S05_25365 [Vibrio splendidus]|nr:hypothetical protein [Vibrio splendidus]